MRQIRVAVRSTRLASEGELPEAGGVDHPPRVVEVTKLTPAPGRGERTPLTYASYSSRSRDDRQWDHRAPARWPPRHASARALAPGRGSYPRRGWRESASTQPN